MVENRIIVKRHVRRRTGRTAKLAEILGMEPIVMVGAYRRRRPKNKKEKEEIVLVVTELKKGALTEGKSG